jgi:hypothetical protein
MDGKIKAHNFSFNLYFRIVMPGKTGTMEDGSSTGERTSTKTIFSVG